MYSLCLDSLKRRNQMGTATCCHLDLAHLKARGGEQSTLSDPKISSPIKKHIRSSMALQVNSIGRVDIQVKKMRAEQDRQSVVLALCYSRHETDFNCATTWWRTLWRDSEPHETHFGKTPRPNLKDMADTLRQRRFSLDGQ